MSSAAKELLAKAIAQRTENDLARVKKLSDSELMENIQALRATEQRTTIEIIVHLVEIESRKLHLSLGYPSLFEYCRSLGYSDAGAGRRITAGHGVLENFQKSTAY